MNNALRDRVEKKPVPDPELGQRVGKSAGGEGLSECLGCNPHFCAPWTV